MATHNSFIHIMVLPELWHHYDRDQTLKHYPFMRLWTVVRSITRKRMEREKEGKGVRKILLQRKQFRVRGLASKLNVLWTASCESCMSAG